MVKEKSIIRYNLSIQKIIDKTIFIIGAPRTGTSYFGNLFGSFKNVEYFHEPYFINNLLNYSDELETKTFKNLFYTYMHEDLYFNSLTGRSINTNLKDISSIFNYKSKKEIEQRFNQNNSRQKILNKYKSNRLIIKSIYPITKFKKSTNRINEFNTIVIYRNLNDTLNSMVKKKWFENNENYKLMGELYQSKNNKNYPIFLDKLDFSFWDDLDVINKCAYYYYIHYRNINFHKKLFLIDYDGYEKKMFEIISLCKSKFGLLDGTKTKKIILDFKATKSENDLVSKVDKKILSKVYKLKSEIFNFRYY
tara:strand:+ start:16873 stop:17793 length:921 start_codon:yes stop_codon:yes gene_type:complete